MRVTALIVAGLALVGLTPAFAADGKQSPIPKECPVTRSTPETRFTPPPPSTPAQPDGPMFWYGSDALYVYLASDGRWRGMPSATGTTFRSKSFWYRKNPEWREEFPYQFKATAKRFDSDGPMFMFPNVNNAIMGEEVAMLSMLELPRGCWEVTGNYKSDSLSWVTWVE
jgi:hypothetical protein